MYQVDRIREMAHVSVGRACMFGVIAITCVVVGLIAWPVLAMRAGAVLSTLTAVILMLKSLQAERRPYRKSETWLLLERRHDLPEEHAQRIISGVLVETFRHFAFHAAVIALAFWLAALLLGLLGIDQVAVRGPN
jgi:hypothetical protein